MDINYSSLKADGWLDKVKLLTRQYTTLVERSSSRDGRLLRLSEPLSSFEEDSSESRLEYKAIVSKLLCLSPLENISF